MNTCVTLSPIQPYKAFFSLFKPIYKPPLNATGKYRNQQNNW